MLVQQQHPHEDTSNQTTKRTSISITTHITALQRPAAKHVSPGARHAGKDLGQACICKRGRMTSPTRVTSMYDDDISPRISERSAEPEPRLDNTFGAFLSLRHKEKSVAQSIRWSHSCKPIMYKMSSHARNDV